MRLIKKKSVDYPFQKIQTKNNSLFTIQDSFLTLFVIASVQLQIIHLGTRTPNKLKQHLFFFLLQDGSDCLRLSLQKITGNFSSFITEIIRCLFSLSIIIVNVSSGLSFENSFNTIDVALLGHNLESTKLIVQSFETEYTFVGMVINNIIL